uniref:Uncharacterized protein n=1 Tax=Human betaherpesvirus 6 TaxID=10368 RepID=A0A5P9V2P8_9BETA|nr:hypothetical protein [Human betaherpesvirus 6]
MLCPSITIRWKLTYILVDKRFSIKKTKGIF